MIALKYLHQVVTSNYPADDHVRMGWWLLSYPILLGVLLYAFFTILRNWRAPKHAFIRSALLVLGTVLGADLASYVQEAYLRVTVKPSACTVQSWSPHGPYRVVVCTTGGRPQDANDEGFVRLYSTLDGTVIAEAAFCNPTYDKVFWASDRVSVGAGSGGADIQLPPTRWDWFRAKLP